MSKENKENKEVNIKVTLSIDKDTYNDFRQYCKDVDAELSAEVELMILQKLSIIRRYKTSVMMKEVFMK